MDTSILWFFLLTVVNVALISFVIYRWGMFSAEGYCYGPPPAVGRIGRRIAVLVLPLQP